MRQLFFPLLSQLKIKLLLGKRPLFLLQDLSAAFPSDYFSTKSVEALSDLNTLGYYIANKFK